MMMRGSEIHQSIRVNLRLAFGRAFSEQGEQDQAMAAYRTAHRCLPAFHIPLLCVGIEFIRAHNFNLARQYLRQVRFSADTEMGCHDSAHTEREGEREGGAAWFWRLLQGHAHALTDRFVLISRQENSLVVMMDRYVTSWG